jgi:hypothetical protein
VNAWRNSRPPLIYQIFDLEPAQGDTSACSYDVFRRASRLPSIKARADRNNPRDGLASASNHDRFTSLDSIKECIQDSAFISLAGTFILVKSVHTA